MKNYHPDIIGRTLRAAIVAGAGFSLFAAVTAHAQQAAAPAAASDDKTIKLEKYVVTGSNIPTTETASEARTFPVQTIDRRAIEASGIFSTTELLQKMTLSNGGSVPIGNNATGFTPGGTSTSLRGLGPEATLVLINGRRMAPYPVGQSGAIAFVDLNTIPLAAVERIEVLKDGASATYGADAVAGVVNIILRRDYNGAVADVSVANTTNKDATDFNASMVYGIAGDKGSITIGANFQKKNAIFNRDRDYSSFPPFQSTNASPPNFQLTRAAVEEALHLAPGGNIPGIAAGTNVFFGTTGPVIGGDVRNPAPGNQNANNNGLLGADKYTYSNGRLSRFNFNEVSGSAPEITRQGMFMSWERQVAGPNIKFYGDGFFQAVHQIDELAPYATGNFETPGSTTIVIPARTPNPILTPSEIANNGGQRTAVAGAFNPFNPFNQDIAGSSRIRLAEFGNRIYHNRNTAFAFTGGVRVDNIADKWSVDTKARFSSITNQDNIKLISTQRLLRALNANDPIYNPASPSFIGTTSPYNPFGFFRNPIPANSAPVAFATQFQRDENSSTIADFGTSISTGELFEMPAGSVGAAFGFDFRREAITQSPDSALQAGEILAAAPASPIDRQRKIASYSAEFEIPIFSEKHSASGFHSLSLNLAGRYESFVTSKRHAAVPKLGLRWTPIDDTFVVRASWGKGFREPSLYELFAPPITGLTPITDPVKHSFEPEQTVSTTGNAKLSAESTKSYNVGIVWSPKGQLEGFSYSMDLWQIERNGTVTANLQNLVDRAAGVAPGGLAPGESVIRDFAGNLSIANGIYRNQGQTKINGFDIATSYVMKTENWGRFDFGLNATYLHTYLSATIPGVPLAELVNGEVPGTVSDDAYLHWKGQAFVGWNWKGLNTRLTATYTDHFNELDASGNAPDGSGNGLPRVVNSTIFYDLQISYTFFPSKNKAAADWWSDLKLTAGVNNLFDKDPPRADGNSGNSNGYPGFLYNDSGRIVYVGFEKKL